MEDSIKNNQFKLIQTYSDELSNCEKINSGLVYTVKHVDQPSARRTLNLKNEVKFLKNSKLYHPNIVSLLWFEETGSSISIFYEYCNGGPLSFYSKIEALNLFQQICQGVSYLHSKSIVHKNLSTNNILIHNNVPKIANFEIAEKTEILYPEESDNQFVEDYWKPPEISENFRFSKESDIWNLGLIFYFLVYKRQVKFPLQDDPRPQYRDIFSMTLSLDPTKRANIETLLKKVSERGIKEPITVVSCACFPLFMKSGKSTVSLLKKVLFKELLTTSDKNIARLIDKVVANPKKIQKFFQQIRKQTEEAHEIVKIRACIVLFCYLKDAPLIVYTQNPGVLEILSAFMMVKQARDSDRYLEVSQSFCQVIQSKFYLIRSSLPRLSGSFKSIDSDDFGIDTIRQLIWYWDVLLNFHELLLPFGSSNDFRTIRLATIEEQVNLYKFIYSKISKLPNTQSLHPVLSNYQNNLNLAKFLFKEDRIEFPDFGAENMPLNILDEEIVPVLPKIKVIKPVSRKPSQNFSSIILEEDRPGTIYGTPLRSSSLNNLKLSGFNNGEILPPELNKKINNSLIKHKELKYISNIGKGNSCEVWLGLYKKQKVAIKKHSSSESHVFIEFFRELSVIATLKHENLIQYFGACVEHPLVIVTEYCEGGDLFILLHRSPSIALNWGQKLEILKQIARGMSYLHSNSFIHRDLKSLNVLIKKEVNEKNTILVKISDFGLSRVFSDGDYMTGQLGTYHWMAPEVLKSMQYTVKADVYSFGIVMFEVITRTTPYRRMDLEEIRTQIIHSGLRPDISLVPEDCHKVLKSLMMLCWSEDPEARPYFSKILDILNTVKLPKN